MPYNNNPIPPSKEVTGTVALPLARVKKIIATDDDVAACSNNAAFVITVATEMFLQHLVEQSYNIVKSERKPRRNVQYRDVANAVARVENLEFLSDVVPRTTTLRVAKHRAAEKAAAPPVPPPPPAGAAPPPPNGQGPMDEFMQSTDAATAATPVPATVPIATSIEARASDDAAPEAMDVDQADDEDDGGVAVNVQPATNGKGKAPLVVDGLSSPSEMES